MSGVLAAMPLLWIVVTLGAYIAGQGAQRLCAGSPLVQPVLVAIVLIGGGLIASGVPYATYFAGARFIDFLLGPATVALAVPLAHNIGHVRRSLKGVGLALLAGSAAAMASGAALVWVLGGSRVVALSMAPKAATTPIAMAVSRQIGGLPALSAALAICGGIIAAALGRRVLAILRIKDQRIQGFAAGLAGSGIAAAQAASLGELAAAFAALGIALGGLATALLAPLLLALWG